MMCSILYMLDENLYIQATVGSVFYGYIYVYIFGACKCNCI